MSEIPLSLYIHIPWCERKCPYCDFNSHDNKSHFDEQAYVAALLEDLQQESHLAANRAIQSIFIGGGTPSLFSAQALQSLLDSAQDYLQFDHQIEITLEANPGSAEREKFHAYREAGINRLSIGVQSFNNQHLQKLGRIHSADDAIKAAAAAVSAGFDNFNLDLMFALPEQTTQQVLVDIKQALELRPTHLSCYQLTLEPNTVFYRQKPELPDTDIAWEMQQALQQLLADNGFSQYEVSAYARDNRQCHHNSNYWQFGDYLGIGAGAHGKITQQDGQIIRYWKQKHPRRYLETCRSEQRYGDFSNVAVESRPFEFMLNALRLKNGFAEKLYEERTLTPLDAINPIIEKHVSQGLLSRSEQHITPTSKGYRFVDNMLNDYL